MRTHTKIYQETLFFLILAGFVASFFVWQSNSHFKKQFWASVPILAGREKNIISPVPSSTLELETASQVSPDGTKKLNLKIKHNNDGSKSYIFTTSDNIGKDQKILYQKTVSNTERFDLPFNAWSPDNKYLFIYKNESDALVFKASGEPFASDQVFYLSALDIFKSKNKTHILSEITGWASEELLIINAKDRNNQKASFWLEIPSKAVIPLSSVF